MLFGNKIIAEMRGVSNEAGRSPFWESLGRHFFKRNSARPTTSPAWATKPLSPS